MKMTKYQVYQTTNTLNNKYYIGIHKGDIFEDDYYGSGRDLVSFVKALGTEYFEREVLADNLTRKQALWLERAIVGKDVVGDEMSYNLAKGGNTPPVFFGEDHWSYGLSTEDHPLYGTKRSGTGLSGDDNPAKRKEVRKKLALQKLGDKNPMYNRTGENHPMYGKSHSEESKLKMSESSKGNTPWNKGKKLGARPQHERDQISKTMKGRVQTHSLKAIIQYDKEGNKIKEYISTAEAERQIGVSGIAHCLKGRNKTSGGFIWKYKQTK